MYNRKQNVIKMSQQLFIEKGIMATSIQDILDYCGISKGTFYNYFSSKSELLIAIYKTIYQKLEKDRNDLMLGQDPIDIEIFIKQLEMQLLSNRKNKLIPLYEEVITSNDVDLKQFIQRSRLRSLNWLYGRFIDIFGKDKKAYLLDCAIMFQGILQHNIQYNRMANNSGENISIVVRFSVGRLVKLVDEVVESGQQLHEPNLLEKWLPGSQKHDHDSKHDLLQLIGTFQKAIIKNVDDEGEQVKYIELVDFLKEELLHASTPRKFLIESALSSLQANSLCIKQLQQLELFVAEHFRKLEEIETP